MKLCMSKPSLESLWSLEIIGIRDSITPNNDDETLLKNYNASQVSQNIYQYQHAQTKCE